MKNPLLENSNLPDFKNIKPFHIEPAIDFIISENRKKIKKLVNEIKDPTWENFVEVIDEWDEQLTRAWSPISHLNSVMNSDEIRTAYNNCLLKISNYSTEISQDYNLYEKYKNLSESDNKLNTHQQRVLNLILQDFLLSGIDLSDELKKRFKKNNQILSELSSKFSENILDCSNSWQKKIKDFDVLKGIPKSVIYLLKQNAASKKAEGWIVNLDQSLYVPIMQHADNRELRKELYIAFNTRASDGGPHDKKFDNSIIMEKILKIRHEQAQLLGFKNFAERSIEKKMANSTKEVIDFLKQLILESKLQAKRELSELKAFAKTMGCDKLEAWDFSYYSEKLRKKRYQISSEEIKSFFPENKVVSGMFEVMSRIFKINFKKLSDVETWHKDVKCFSIIDKKGELIAKFYLDLYARPNKQGGAWMDSYVGRRVTKKNHQIPVAFITCNFSRPIRGEPTLLNHEEIETLFHEFGHGLHHMLTKIDYPSISGINGVAWDAVELPSQFMENLCWNPDILKLLSEHHLDSRPISSKMIKKMQSAKNFQSAIAMLRQIEFSLFDFLIHKEFDPSRGGRIYEILDKVRQQTAVLMTPKSNRFAHSFSHIFSGGYAAGYYSYKWAEVLSADAFSLFEEKGIFNDYIGKSFLKNILEMGGSADASVLFKRFRGRDPKIDALLRYSGITQQSG